MSFSSAIATTVVARDMHNQAREIAARLDPSDAGHARCKAALEQYVDRRHPSYPSWGIGVPVDGHTLSEWLDIGMGLL